MDWPTITGNEEPAGEEGYVAKLNLLSTNGEAMDTEIVAARDGEASLTAKIAAVQATAEAAGSGAGTVTAEVVEARSGEASLLARLNAIIASLVAKTGLDAIFSAGNNRITDLQDGVDPQDAVSVAQANALLVGGGTPSAIPITSLGLGSLNVGDLVTRVGSAVVGLARSALGVTELGVGTVAAGQVLGNVGGVLVGVAAAIQPRTVTASATLATIDKVAYDTTAAGSGASIAQTVIAPVTGGELFLSNTGNDDDGDTLVLTPAAGTEIVGAGEDVTDADTLTLLPGESVHLIGINTTTWRAL